MLLVKYVATVPCIRVKQVQLLVAALCLVLSKLLALAGALLTLRKQLNDVLQHAIKELLRQLFYSLFLAAIPSNADIPVCLAPSANSFS